MIQIFFYSLIKRNSGALYNIQNIYFRSLYWFPLLLLLLFDENFITVIPVSIKGKINPYISIYSYTMLLLTSQHSCLDIYTVHIVILQGYFILITYQKTLYIPLKLLNVNV